MKRLLPIFLALFLLLSGCGSSAGPDDGNTLHIVATTYPLYLFTTAVTEGAENVEVTQLITEEISCLHDYTLTVNDMKTIEQADVIVMNGAGLEDFMSDALSQSTAFVINCSDGVDLLPAQEHEDHDGHDHGEEWDPHIWMDPVRAGQMMDHIALSLQELTGDAEYRERGLAAQDKLAEACQAWAGQKEALSGLPLITFHDGFQYFSDAFGLTLLKSIEEEEGSEASAAEIKEIVALIEEYDVPAIFTEKNGSDATAQAIARETGVAVYQLDMIMSGAGSGISPYLDAMNANLDTLVQALGGN